jgi:hypothetical protein
VPKEPAPGYLTEVEASHLEIRALPGAIVLQLRRDLEAETVAGRRVRRMFIELTLGEAVQHWRAVGDLIRKAGALEQQPPHADAAANL